MTRLVVDASLLASWMLPDEDGSTAEAILRDPALTQRLGPAHLAAEIGNLLHQAGRRGRISVVKLELARQAVADLSLELDPPGFGVSWRQSAVLADRHMLTVYDAAYLELALRTGARFATLDKALARAARTEGATLAV